MTAVCSISPLLPANPTKAQELAHWRAFLETLPAGCYLSDLFNDSLSAVESMLRNDLAFPLIPELVKEREHYRAEADEAEKRRNALHDEVTSLEARARQAKRDAERAHERLTAIKAEALTLSR